VPRSGVVIAVLAALAVTTTGCTDPRVGTIGGRVRVVAAENFWGSIARQLGGAHAQVQSLIVNPAQDPHSYEPTTGDARAMATAQLAIVNGAGYDPWAPKLLAANPVTGRITLTVGTLLHLREGDNPHRWYDPADVTRVAQTITADLQRLDPPHKLYFAQRLTQFDVRGLAGYRRLIAQIRRRYRGVPVGASESIFALQAPALGLDLITPPGFMKAVSEGAEVGAQDTVATERQLAAHRVKVWLYNTQNVTPEVQRLNRAARAAGIPTVTVTETLSPASDTFQQWQVAQLSRLQAALARATGR
jgi:zinc/manganese transport system substrate-binding protein